jgi:hypothetical protein
MRLLRLIPAMILAASLAILPVSAALAMMHTADPGMAMGASPDDCPCCKPNRSDVCPMKCSQLSALTVADAGVQQPARVRFDEVKAVAFVAVLVRPEPPPPRS